MILAQLALALTVADPVPQPPRPLAPASQPASQPQGTVELRLRVIYGHGKTTALDPKLNDLFGLLKNLAYQAYELKQDTNLKLTIDGESVKHTTPMGRHIVIDAKGYKKQKGQGSVRVELEIPELKFKTKVTIMAGATLVIGGPKFEDGVLLFALTATSIAATPPASGPTQK